MFSKISRYRKLPDEVTVGPDGFAFQSKSLRLIPDVDGTFLHTVEDVDRLDHLGYKYYKQPKKWWRICDANPEFLSPQQMLGKEPIVTGEFPIAFGAGEPPYAETLATLRNMAGVENALLMEDDPIVTVRFPISFVGSPRFDEILASIRSIAGVENASVGESNTVIVVTFKALAVGRGTIRAVIAAAGLTVGIMQTARTDGAMIVVTFNTMTIAQSAITAAIAADGFTVGEMQGIGRIGKKIVIPPDSIV